MLRSYRLLILTAITIILIIGSFGTIFLSNRTPSAFATSNLVNNPGFETGNLNGWSCDAGDAVVGSPVHSGSFALQMNPTSSTTGQCTQTISVQPNTAYTLSDFVNGPFAYIGVLNGS
ncbi:MAG TPA: carbohydrate binding domain-containing protein, partial [Ktedonobacteraceae bacterium]|nr:carbohydrate binding domain-containing protein [Ktedonobacteraceae bacterium]